MMGEGYFTVEAAILFPLLMFVFLAFIYMAVYRYDRAMLFQDSCLMAEYAAEDYRTDQENYKEKLADRFQTVREERPYLALENLSMSVSKDKAWLTIKSSGDYLTPFGKSISWFEDEDETMECECSVTTADPVTIMLETKDLVGK